MTGDELKYLVEHMNPDIDHAHVAGETPIQGGLTKVTLWVYLRPPDGLSINVADGVKAMDLFGGG